MNNHINSRKNQHSFLFFVVNRTCLSAHAVIPLDSLPIATAATCTLTHL